MKKRRVARDNSNHYTPLMCDVLFLRENSVSPEFRSIIAESLSKLPTEIVDWASEKVNFISSSEQHLALALSSNELKDQLNGFVFLSEELKTEHKEKQVKTIAHEIAHIKLNHRSILLSDITNEEGEKQEKEADELAERWLNMGRKCKTVKKKF